MRISIVMAVYNAEAYLNEAIESVLNQDYENWEMICVDDGSSDSSLHILNSYSRIDKRIKVIRSIHSGKASVARNMALPYISGDYTCILDSDDKFEPDTLSELVSVISKEEADFVVFLTKFCDSKCTSLIKEISGFKGDFDAILTGVNAFIASLDWKISGIGAIKSELVQRIKWNEVGMNGDELSTRLFFLESQKVAFTRGTYLYRQHSESTTKKLSTKKYLTLDTSLSIIGLINQYAVDEKIRFKEINKYGRVVREYCQSFIKNKSYFSTKEKIKLKKYLKRHYFEVLNLEIPHHLSLSYKEIKWFIFYCKTETLTIKNFFCKKKHRILNHINICQIKV